MIVYETAGAPSRPRRRSDRRRPQAIGPSLPVRGGRPGGRMALRSRRAALSRPEARGADPRPGHGGRKPGRRLSDACRPVRSSWARAPKPKPCGAPTARPHRPRWPRAEPSTSSTPTPKAFPRRRPRRSVVLCSWRPGAAASAFPALRIAREAGIPAAALYPLLPGWTGEPDALDALVEIARREGAVAVTRGRAGARRRNAAGDRRGARGRRSRERTRILRARPSRRLDERDGRADRPGPRRGRGSRASDDASPPGGSRRVRRATQPRRRVSRSSPRASRPTSPAPRCCMPRSGGSTRAGETSPRSSAKETSGRSSPSPEKRPTPRKAALRETP